MDNRKGNEAVASGPSFPEIPCPLLRALHRCLVEKVIRTTLKAHLKKLWSSHLFFKIGQKLWEHVPKEAAFKYQLQNCTYFCSFRMYIMLLNLVH